MNAFRSKYSFDDTAGIAIAMIFIVIGILLTLGVFFKMYVQGGPDFLTLLTLVAFIILWFACPFWYNYHPDVAKKAIPMVFVAGMMALCVVQFPFGGNQRSGADGTGVTINATTGQTTMSRWFLIMNPFTARIYYVPEGFSQVRHLFVMKKTDGIPVECSVTVKQVRLDRRNPAALESYLLQLANTGDPDKIITGQLQDALEQGVLWATSEEGRRMEHYMRYYTLGMRVRAEMTRLHLQWKDSEIGYSCGRIIFDN